MNRPEEEAKLTSPLKVVAWKSPMWRFYPTRFNAVQNGEQLLEPLVRLVDHEASLQAATERAAKLAATLAYDAAIKYANGREVDFEKEVGDAIRGTGSHA
jgi:hypothetical protein